jgi:UrcA family protein
MTTFNTVSRRLAMKSTMRSVGSTSCLGAILMLSFGMLASAANADQLKGDSRSQQINLNDLDLSTADGQRIAQQRMHDVAHTLCSRVADDLDLSHQANYIKCVDAAVAKSNARLQALINRQPTPALARADVK